VILFESLGTVSYTHSIVTMAITCIVYETKRDIGRKSRFFYIPLHSTPLLWGAHADWNGNTIMVWLPEPDGEKNLMIHSAVSIEYRRVSNKRTERRTDRWTDGWTDILRQHNARYA